MNTLRLLALAACAAAIGCDAGPQQGRGVHQVSWSISTADGPSVPGLDDACVLFGTYGDAAALTIWSDGPGASFGAGFDKSRNATHYSGTVASQDARKIEINAYTTDGKTGDVTIDGQKFDLANGSLFLVKTADGETQVQQSTLKVPKPKEEAHGDSTGPSEKLRDFGKSNEQIREFFGAGGEDEG